MTNRHTTIDRWPFLHLVMDKFMPFKTFTALLLILLTSCVQAPLDSVDEMRYFARDRNAANRINVYGERYSAAKKRATQYREEAIKLEDELGRIRGLIQQARDLNTKASSELNLLNAANEKLASELGAAKAKQSALKNGAAPKAVVPTQKKPAAATATKKPAGATKKPVVAPKK